MCQRTLYRVRSRVLAASRACCFALSAILFAAGCGGGGGGSSPSPAPPPTEPPPTSDPFGLTERPSLASFDLPGQGVDLGTYQLVDAFPGVSTGFQTALYVSGIPRAGDDRLIVVRQTGQMELVDRADDSVVTVLDLSDRVITEVEQGLLGLAFDPGFQTNGYLYVHYSVDGPRRSVIARFTWPDPENGVVDTGSEKVLLELPQPAENHNGGMLEFGPDDMLYIAFGDGGADSSESQDPGTLYGSLLRVDPHPEVPTDPYDVPPNNPFVDSSGGERPEIYAYGLRNPFRFSFDRQTGELWLADVGAASREEINIISAGGNYGWPIFEGTLQRETPQPGVAYEAPIFEYDHSVGSGVIGGYVYRGNALPGLVGRYVYTDLSSANVWALLYEGGTVQSNETIASGSGSVSLGEDQDGELYIATRFNGIFQFEATSGGGEIPDHLSETGVFTDLNTLTPASGLIEYDINHPFWSDGSEKRRWIGVPDAGEVAFSASAEWVFPVGTVIVKHFEMLLAEGDPNSAERLETRLLVHTQDGWQGFTYRWNDDQTDAVLLSGRETEELTIQLAAGGTRTQIYEYPSRTDCLTCHTEEAGFALGLKTVQLNRDFAYPNATDNQLRSWNNIELFDQDIGDQAQYDAFVDVSDTSASLQERARTYLDVNCAQCHQPGTTAPTDLDLRFATANGGMNAIGEPPTQGDLGITDARIIAAGDRERSVLWQRMRELGVDRMPPISSHLVDDAAAEVIGDWIETL